MSSNEKLQSVNFEVFGRVQGVFFRKYTEKEANKLGLRGWCRNTKHDTVQGVIEGNPLKIAQIYPRLGKDQANAIYDLRDGAGKLAKDPKKKKQETENLAAENWKPAVEN